MEFTLHRQLKELYASRPDQIEVRVGRFRIDVMTDNELIEIQHGSLSAIRTKVKQLLKDFSVVVVKPIIVRKTLIKLDRRGGEAAGKRMSPKTGRLLDLFHELTYFTQVFPANNLRLEVPLIDVEEWRFPGCGRRRWKRQNDYVVQDQKLIAVRQIHRFRTGGDLWDLVPGDLPCPFHTRDLADLAESPRQLAQRIVYCLRNMGAARTVGKQGNAILYERCA
jgi:hypothetical protein